MSRILIAVPTYENIYPDTFKSIYQLDKGGNDVDFDFIRGYDVARARNRIAEVMLEGGYDYVLMLDNDEVMPKDALVNFLQTEQSFMTRNMVVGYCLARPANKSNQNRRTTVWKFGGNKSFKKEDAYTADELQALKEKGITRVQVRGSGLGCALIHRSVFKRMEYPYFKWTEYKSKEQLSEDLYFCTQFRRHQIPIFVDTRVACGHLMRHIEYI